MPGPHQAPDPSSSTRARDEAFLAFQKQFHDTPVAWRQYSAQPASSAQAGDYHLTVTQVQMTIDEARVHWMIAWDAALAAHRFLEEQRG